MKSLSKKQVDSLNLIKAKRIQRKINYDTKQARKDYGVKGMKWGVRKHDDPEKVQKNLKGGVGKYDAERISKSLERVGELQDKPVEYQAKEFSKAYKDFSKLSKEQREKAKTGEDILDGTYNRYLEAEGKVKDIARSIVYTAVTKGKGAGVSDNVYEKIKKFTREMAFCYGPKDIVSEKYKENYPHADW